MVKSIKMLFAAPAVLWVAGMMAAQANTVEDMALRLAPVGKVCLQGQNCFGPSEMPATEASSADPVVTEPLVDTAAPATEPAVETPATESSAEPVSPPASDPATAEPVAATGRQPKEIYDMLCHVCHATGLLEAPKFGDSAAWQQRADEQGGLEGLLARSITGYNLMPPKGSCMNCTDDELRATIQYMSGL